LSFNFKLEPLLREKKKDIIIPTTAELLKSLEKTARRKDRIGTRDLELISAGGEKESGRSASKNLDAQISGL